LKVIDVSTPGKLVSSACYDTQQVCLSATVLLLDWTTVAGFEGGTQIWCICTENSLNPSGGQTLHHWNLHLMHLIVCRLSWFILNGFGTIHS